MTTLEELAELLAASTPAPWKVNQYWLDIPWLNRADAALIVAAINALPGLVESARRVERLEAALKECADELEAEFRNRHSPDLHPSSERRFNRDMETVRDARAALKGT
jgi:hypothetical protein